MTIHEDFTTPTTGFNARATALAAAAVAAYASTTSGAVAAVLAERASLAADVIECLLGSTTLGPNAGAAGGTGWSGWIGTGRVPDRFIDEVRLVVDAASLNDVLPRKRDGGWLPSDGNGYNASAAAAAGVAKLAAFEARFQAAAA